MKSKFVQFFTVCFVTFVVLSPALAVFSIIWERHIELVQIRALNCEINRSREHSVQLAPIQKSKNSYSDQSQTQLFDTKFTNQSLISLENPQTVKLLQFLFLFFPILIGVFVILYDKYLIYRTVNFQQQVEMLERIWQQNIEQ
jgi:hypothetical protein